MSVVAWVAVLLTLAVLGLLWVVTWLLDRLEATRSRVRYWQDRALRSPWRACGCGKDDDHAA